MHYPEIRVGDCIYIDTELHLSHGVDDIRGGKTLVTRVENGWVWVALDPLSQYHLETLQADQGRLQEKFGDQWASRDPDLRPEFNSYF
jgi:hypothetical protein